MFGRVPPLPRRVVGNDPSAGSPTETLLRLLHPLNSHVWASFRHAGATRGPLRAPVRRPHKIIQSVAATGGVDKGQGLNQHELMTRAYWGFLVQGEQLQAPIPSTKEIQRVTHSCRKGKAHAVSFNVARVRPRASEGITDLLLLCLARLDAACPSKKNVRRR